MSPLSAYALAVLKYLAKKRRALRPRVAILDGAPVESDKAPDALDELTAGGFISQDADGCYTPTKAGLNITMTLFFCFIAVWVGFLAARLIHGHA